MALLSFPHQRFWLVRRGEGRGNIGSLTLGLSGTNPRFPWKPSATMLTYGLADTTEASGSTTTNTLRIRPATPRTQPAGPTESSRPTVRFEDGAGMLTCGGAKGTPHSSRGSRARRAS